MVLRKMLLLLLITVGCSTGNADIRGSGNITTESRSVSGFTEIEVGAGAEVLIQIGDTEALTVETDDNLQNYVETRVEAGVLRFASRDDASLQPTQLRYTITMPTLEKINLSGGVQGTVAGEIDVDNLTIVLSGGSGLTVSGEAQNQSLELSGGSRFDGRDLQGQSVTINVSGGSNVVVNAAQSLNVNASGGSEVQYVGEPEVLSDLSGDSEVNPLE